MTAKDKGGKHMEQMKNRKEHEATEKFANGLADEFRAFWADEDGVGVIEVVLILVGIFTPNSRYILCRYSGNSGNRETV